MLREAGKDLLHGLKVWCGRVCRGELWGAAGCAVGEDGDCIVGGSVAVNGDGVVRAIASVSEEGLEGGGGDRGIGAEDAEEGRHVGVDHASAFSHAGEGIGDLRSGGKGEGC